jgi:hypothetical protein
MTRLALLALMALMLTSPAPAEEETAETKAAPVLSDAERASLLYMREEEKLARDLYTTLADTHDLAVFRTIAAAEQRHMDAIRGLLRRFEIEDVAGKGSVGTFTDESLAELYASLVEQGRKSPIEALAAAAHVEDRDIHDLNVGLADAKNEDLRAVYSNLVRASRNHLRAFTSRLAAEGVTYVPQHLEQAEYDAIVSSDHEHGHGGGAGFRGGRGAGGGRGPAAGAGRDSGRGQGRGRGASATRGNRGGCGGTAAGSGRGNGRGGRDCGRAARGRGRGGSSAGRGAVGRGRGAGDRCDSRRGCDRDRTCDCRDRGDRRDDRLRDRRADCEREGTGPGRGAGRGRGRGRGCEDGCR